MSKAATGEILYFPVSRLPDQSGGLETNDVTIIPQNISHEFAEKFLLFLEKISPCVKNETQWIGTTGIAHDAVKTRAQFPNGMDIEESYTITGVSNHGNILRRIQPKELERFRDGDSMTVADFERITFMTRQILRPYLAQLEQILAPVISAITEIERKKAEEMDRSQDPPPSMAVA